jgi:hypothetical protein
MIEIKRVSLPAGDGERRASPFKKHFATLLYGINLSATN